MNDGLSFSQGYEKNIPGGSHGVTPKMQMRPPVCLDRCQEGGPSLTSEGKVKMILRLYAVGQ